jgi:hypothetical protein
MPAQDGLDDLLRRAYGRPAEGEDPQLAQAELARLNDRRDNGDGGPALIALPELPPHRVPGILVRVVLALASAAAAVGAPIAVATAPVDSMLVFARPQTAVDRTAPSWLAPMRNELDGGVDIGAVQESIRFLARGEGAEVFAYLTRSEDLCIVLVDEFGASSACDDITAFREGGIELGMYRKPSIEGYCVMARWGPVGEPRLTREPRSPIDCGR